MLTTEDIQAISNLINNAIQPLRNDINDLKKEVKELKGAFGKLTDRVVSIEKFIKIESTGIEDELNKAILMHLPHRFPGFQIKPFTLKNIFNPTGNNQITELDGAFLLTYKLPNSKIPTINYLVIVEAKHHVDYTRINSKLEQIYILKEYLQAAKDVTNTNSHAQYTKKFKNIVKNYNLDTINEIYLYIGGPTWENNMIKYIKSLNNTNDNNINSIVDSERLQLDKITKEQFKDVLIYMKDHIGTIVPKGTRYIINDISEMTGGSNKQTSVPMIILPNYMNTVYT